MFSLTSNADSKIQSLACETNVGTPFAQPLDLFALNLNHLYYVFASVRFQICGSVFSGHGAVEVQDTPPSNKCLD